MWCFPAPRLAACSAPAKLINSCTSSKISTISKAPLIKQMGDVREKAFLPEKCDSANIFCGKHSLMLFFKAFLSIALSGQERVLRFSWALWFLLKRNFPFQYFFTKNFLISHFPVHEKSQQSSFLFQFGEVISHFYIENHCFPPQKRNWN